MSFTSHNVSWLFPYILLYLCFAHQQYQEERARKAYIEPKELWTEAELAEYNGTKDIDGPILLAADGLVFNVYKGRNFYGPGGEYAIFAGVSCHCKQAFFFAFTAGLRVKMM